MSGADPDCEDLDQRTPLHSAIVKGSRSYECVKMLLDVRANVNHQDKFGYSPLHIAALNEYGYCANLLLCHGADITVRTNGGTTALSMIVRKIPSVLPKFEDMLDQAITLAEHDINDVDCELKLGGRNENTDSEGVEFQYCRLQSVDTKQVSGGEHHVHGLHRDRPQPPPQAPAL